MNITFCTRLHIFCLSLMHTCKHTQRNNILSCLCCCLNTPFPLALILNPPAVSQGGETQTRAQRALSTPQPLNTSSALPFENKPRRQAPVSNSRLICEHTCPTLRWELFGDFPAAVPGSRCENGGDQAWCFAKQCGGHYSHCEDMEEVRGGASSAVARSWSRWRSAKAKASDQRHIDSMCLHFVKLQKCGLNADFRA